MNLRRTPSLISKIFKSFMGKVGLILVNNTKLLFISLYTNELIKVLSLKCGFWAKVLGQVQDIGGKSTDIVHPFELEVRETDTQDLSDCEGHT